MNIIETRRNYEADTYTIVFDSSKVYLDQELKNDEIIPGLWVLKDIETHVTLATIDLR